MTISDEQTKSLWQDLLEKDDRTSPSEYPDMALITFEEFAAALAAAELRGRIKGLKIARDEAVSNKVPPPLGSRALRGHNFACADIVAAISARLASLQPEVAKQEDVPLC